MKRRDFLKLFAVGTAVTMMPLALRNSFSNVDEVIYADQAIQDMTIIVAGQLDNKPYTPFANSFDISTIMKNRGNGFRHYSCDDVLHMIANEDVVIYRLILIPDKELRIDFPKVEIPFGPSIYVKAGNDVTIKFNTRGLMEIYDPSA